MSGVRRRAAVVGAVGAVALAGAAGAAVTGGWSAPPDEDATVSGGAAGEPTAPPPFSVPTPSAPAALDVEPGPEAPVATDAPAPTEDAAVRVVVTFAGVEPSVDGVEVSGFVAGVVEAGGVCSLRLTQGQQSVEASREAVADATTTSCGALVVPLEDLSAGTWDAVLSYSSPSSAGAADPVPVEIR